MKEYIKKFLNWSTDQLSDGLEKSTVGTLMLFGCFGCIVYLTIKEGGSETVESLITTAMIVSATLLGVNSVADVFKVNNNVGKKTGE
jgi:hypothetical protein